MESRIPLNFQENESEEIWRAADLLPGEAGLIGRDQLYIALGTEIGQEVELHVSDPHHMAPGVAGSLLKLHFFFHANNASIVTLRGDQAITPHRIGISIYERITFTARSTVPFESDDKKEK